MKVLEYYNIDLSNKHVVVVGRSNIVGRPISILTSLKRKYSNATTTICHSGTKNISYYTKQADVVILALGYPAFLKGKDIKEKVLLEYLVEQIKLDPRILYDESYVKGWKDELTLERESKVKIVINLLQSVLNELENSSTLLSTKKNFDRWTEAKYWLKEIFTAASSGSLSKLVYFGPDAENFPSDSRLLSEFLSLRSKIDKFFVKFYPYILANNKRKKRNCVDTYNNRKYFCQNF